MSVAVAVERPAQHLAFELLRHQARQLARCRLDAQTCRRCGTPPRHQPLATSFDPAPLHSARLSVPSRLGARTSVSTRPRSGSISRIKIDSNGIHLDKSGRIRSID